MDDLRSWWEVPSIAHFCSLFRSAFDLTDFDIEDLEDALLESEREEGSDFILEIVCKLLNGCYRKEVSPANYDLYVKDIIKYKWENIESPIHKKDTFQELTLREKVELIHALCEYRLDGEDVPELLKGFEGENMRVEPLGKDKDGSTYWYFYGSRLYKEDPEPKKEISKAEKKAKDKKRREELQKKKKEEKLKKKQDKKNEKVMKKRMIKKSKDDKPKKQVKPDPNIRRSGRIQSKKTVETEKDSDSSSGSSSSSESSEESEDESSTEEEEEVEEEKEEPAKGRRGKQKTPAKAKTPAKKGKQPKETSKSTSKKGRPTRTPKQQKSEPVVSQSDSSIRRSSRIKCKKEKPPPPPKFDSDTEEDVDNDDIDSGHESLESDDDKSVKSEVSKYSTTSSVSKATGRARKVPMSKINLNKKFDTAEDTEEEDEEEKSNNKDTKAKQKDEEKGTEKMEGESVKGTEGENIQESDAATNKDKADTSKDDTTNLMENSTISPQETKEITEQPDTCSLAPEKLEIPIEQTNDTQEQALKEELNEDKDTQNNSNEKASTNKEESKPEIMDIDESSESNIDNKDKDREVKEDDKIETKCGNNVDEPKHAENGDIASESGDPVSGQGNSRKEELGKESKDDIVADDSEQKDSDNVKTEIKDGEKETSPSETNEIKTESAEEDVKTEIKSQNKSENDVMKAEAIDNNDASVKDETMQDKSDIKPESQGEKKADVQTGLPKLTKPAVPPPPVSSEGRRWHLVCNTLDDWVNLAEWFKDSPVRCEKSLSKIIIEDFIPVLPEIIEAREKDRKKKLMELEVRRSERITYKQREKKEQEKILAEALAEEEKAKLQAEEERRLKEEQQRLEDENRLREERARAREERAKRLSMREERARLLAEGKEIPPELIYTGTQKYKDDEDSDDSRCDLKDNEDYQNLTKVINAMKLHKDCWPFLEPVTDEVAPGYSDVIKRPMDMSKIEMKVDTKDYRSSSHFLSDFRLMFNNCKRFNGPDSEFTECARSMEKMLKKYIKRFMTDGPTDNYYDDKDFTVGNIRGAGVEKRYRPKRAAGTRALQTVHRALNDDDDFEESSDDEDGEAPPTKRPREFPAQAVSGQSRLLQEMIELKRQRERKLAAGVLDNHQVITRGPDRITVPNQPGGIMVIPREELPPKGVLKLATTREIKRKVDPVSFMSKSPGRGGPGMSVYDKRRTANPPKTIRIVAASNTLSGNASVKETAESVKVSSEGFLIIGGKNSGIKVSENTKIVIQPPAPGGTSQSPLAAGAVAGAKEIFIKKLPSKQAADSSPIPAAKTQKYVNNMSTPSNNLQGDASVKQSAAIITASSSVSHNPGTPNTNQNAIHRASTNITPVTTKPETPDLHKKQVDIATRIIMLNQQKRKMMEEKQQAAPSSQGVMASGAKVIRLDQGGHQSIEDRLRDPAIDAELGSVTKEVVNSVDIASDILDTYYSVLNQRTEEGKSSTIPASHSVDYKQSFVNSSVSNSVRNELLPPQQSDSHSAIVSNSRLVAQSIPSGISNGSISAVHNSAQLVTSSNPSQIAPIALNTLNTCSVNNLGQSATMITNPTSHQTNVSHVVCQPAVGGASMNNLQVNLPGSKPEGPASLQTVLNSATNLTGGKVQVNVQGMSQPTLNQVSLANFALPTLGNTIVRSTGVISAAANISPAVYTQQSLNVLNNVTSQQAYTNNTVHMLDNNVAPAVHNTTVTYIDNTVGPIEALFASNTGTPSVSFSTNPQTLPVPQSASLVDISSSTSPGNTLSPGKANRLNLFDVFDSNSETVVNTNSLAAPVSNNSVIQSLVQPENVVEQSAIVKPTGKQAHMNVPSSSTVKFGSPLKTMSIMEALKSKLNPQKTSEYTPGVSQSNVPKRNLFPVLCSDVDVEACFPQPYIDSLYPSCTACNNNTEVIIDSNTAYNLSTNLDNSITDLETNINNEQPSKIICCLERETSSPSNLDRNIPCSIEPIHNVPDSVHVCTSSQIDSLRRIRAQYKENEEEKVAGYKERKCTKVKTRRDISQHNRIEIICRKSYLTQNEGHEQENKIDPIPEKAVYNSGYSKKDISTDVSRFSYCDVRSINEHKTDINVKPDVIQSLASTVKPGQVKGLCKRPVMRYVMPDRNSPRKGYRPMSYRKWSKSEYSPKASSTDHNMWEDTGASGDQREDEEYKITENFHLVQSWTELQRLTKQGGKPTTDESDPVCTKDQRIYFKLSDTIQRSSINLHPRSLPKHKVSATKYTPRRSKSCDAIETTDTNKTVRYVIKNSNGTETVSYMKIQDKGLRNKVDLVPDELNQIRQRQGINKATFVPKVRQRTQKSKQTQHSPNLNYIDLDLCKHTDRKELSQMRLKRRIECLSTRPVYTLQPLRHNSPNDRSIINPTRKELNFSAFNLKPSQSDSSMQQLEDFQQLDFDDDQMETTKSNTIDPYSCTEYNQTALDSSLTCDRDFFTSDLISNLLPSNFGNGTFDIDPDLENIKDDIFELQDKYLVGHNIPQTSALHVNPVTTYTAAQYSSTSQRTSSIITLPSSSNQPWTNLQTTSITNSTGLTNMIEQTVYPSQVNIETNNPNQIASVFPKHMSGTVVHINTQQDTTATDRPSGIELHTSQEYS